MKRIIKENWKFLLIVLLGGLVGGYFIGLYSYDSLSVEILENLNSQNVTKEMVALSTMFQYGILFGIILAFLGIILSKKVNLNIEFKFNKKALVITLIITIISALILFPTDKLVFGSLNSWVNEQYLNDPTPAKIIGEFLVGGIIEEVMLRLFFMSLIVFLFSKLFYKSKTEIPTKIYIIANIISALVFAILHLPATMSMTTLTPIIIIRCLLFNGVLGLTFGYLYRKYSIGYAMIAHGFAHLIADILMIIFI